MKRAIESSIKQGLRRIGIEISYVNDSNPHLYENILKGAISVKKPFNIIQVGANDGKYMDPIYEFVKKHKYRTNIILIEPQEELVPYLRDNYSYHPSAEIYNKAIGKDEAKLQLYKINKKYWSEIDTEYGERLPDYRVPTGVTTSDKQQLLNWVSNKTKYKKDPTKIIDEYEVDVIRPRSILRGSEIMENICLLQVDTEGMDAEVVCSFFEDDIYPGIINIESKHLDDSNQNKFENKLSERGYEVYNYTSSETLAVRSDFE